MVWGVVIACLLNIGLNFIFIPRFGYVFAAINTLAAYLFLFIFYYVKDDFSFFRNIRLIRIILIILVVLIIQGLVDLFIRRVMDADLNKWLTLLEATLFFAIYIGVVIRLKLFRIRG